MADASLDWKIDCLKTIKDLPSGSAFQEGMTSKQDLIWIQDLERDGYISAKFRMGYSVPGEKFADSTIPNMIWDVHVLDKGRELIEKYEHEENLSSGEFPDNDGGKKSTDQDSGDESGGNPIKEIATPNGNNDVKPKSIWVLFGALDAGVILLFWGYSEFFGSS
jgi:hypothetical protein